MADKRKPVIYQGAQHVIRFFVTDPDTQERVDLTGKTIKVFMLGVDGSTFEASTTNAKVAIIEKGIFDMTLDETDSALIKDGEHRDLEVEITDGADTDIIQRPKGIAVRKRLFS